MLFYVIFFVYLNVFTSLMKFATFGVDSKFCTTQCSEFSTNNILSAARFPTITYPKKKNNQNKICN